MERQRSKRSARPPTSHWQPSIGCSRRSSGSSSRSSTCPSSATTRTLPWPIDRRSKRFSQSATPREQLAGFVAIIVQVNARIAPLYRILVSAAGTDTDAAALLDALTTQRQRGQRLIARSLARVGALRTELRERDAADIIHALLSPELYRLLVLDRAWGPERYERWLAATLIDQLLPASSETVVADYRRNWWDGASRASMSARRSIVLPVTSTTSPRTPRTCRPGRRDSPIKMCSWSMASGSSTRRWDSVIVAFAPSNDFGVLDHDVTLPDGETVRNPMRVISNGDGCDVVFTVRRQPG